VGCGCTYRDFATFLRDVAGEERLGADEDSGVMVVGLHTCGDLAASVIRSFEVCVCVSLSLPPFFSFSLWRDGCCCYRFF